MNIELADFLASLRSEIDQARLESKDKGVLFSVNSIDLELEIAAEKSGQGKAGVKFWVVTVEGGGGVKTQHTQRVKISLGAQTRDGGKVLTSDDVSSLLDDQ